MRSPTPWDAFPLVTAVQEGRLEVPRPLAHRLPKVASAPPSALCSPSRSRRSRRSPRRAWTNPAPIMPRSSRRSWS